MGTLFQVQELEEKLAEACEDLAVQRAAVEAAQRSAGVASQERIAEFQAQLEETQIERDQLQADVHSLEHQLQDQDRRYREVCFIVFFSDILI
jgi:molecular chaperone GrpE (heat shock protein)